MSKLKGLLLTEGMHGMISQVEGLAKALDLDFTHEKIELNNFWKLIPPKFTPIKEFVFKNKINQNFDIVISCGRKSVIPSIFLKKKSKNKLDNGAIAKLASITSSAITTFKEKQKQKQKELAQKRKKEEFSKLNLEKKEINKKIDQLKKQEDKISMKFEELRLKEKELNLKEIDITNKQELSLIHI